jgi:hypothetical protein
MTGKYCTDLKEIGRDGVNRMHLAAQDRDNWQALETTESVRS